MEEATTSGQQVLLPESSRRQRKERKITVEVNSQDRSRAQAVSTNNFRWTFRRPLKDVVAIELVSGCIPADLYNIAPAWASFMFMEDGGAPVKVTLTPGQYTALTLEAELATRLNDSSLGLSNTYSVSYSDTTKRMTISGSTGTTFTFLFSSGLPYVDTVNSTTGVVENILCPAKILGFDATDLTSTPLSGGTTLVPPNRVDTDFLTQRVYLYLNADSSKELTRIEMGAGRHDCFHIIYLANVKNGFYYLNRDMYTPVFYSSPAPISRLSAVTISLRDEFYRLLDLGAHEFNLVFEFTVLD
jgi:hypothetical protein